ncbi:MAG: hypothetical protein GY850_30625, partial [bacterium]|nr:hypothetical protein [bacterium]
FLKNQFSISPSANTGEAASAQYVSSQSELNRQIDIAKVKAAARKVRSGDDFYEHSQQETYGESLYSVKKVWDIDQGVFSEIMLTETMMKELSTYYIHPCVFDACHVTSSYVLGEDPILHHRVPLLIKEGIFRHDIQSRQLAHTFCMVEKINHNDQICEMNIVLYDETGQCLFILNGFTTKRIPNKDALTGGSTAESKPSDETEKKLPTVNIAGAGLEEKIQNYIKQRLPSINNTKTVDISLTQNFMDMGVDSRHMIETAQNIENEIGIELYPTLFFEYQNIKDLSRYFSDEHKEKFSLFLGDTPQRQSGAEKGETVTPKAAGTHRQHTGIYRENPFSQFQSKGAIQQSGDIAIIGMSGYLPGSENLDEFWRHLEAGHDLITEVPEDHWDYRGWFDEDRQAENKTYSKWGGFIKDIDKFDPLFFGIPPRQADWLDPQLRLLLQSVQETIEDAGLAPRIKGSNTGVYVGCCFHEYWDEVVRKQIPIVDFQASSSAMSSLSGTVSYTYDFQGGAIPLDNACASSLTALHLGCRALKAGECEMAIVAGLNVLLSPLHYVYFSRIQALSPTGRCHTFDKKADGYVPGEGIVSVLIKPLDQAVRDGDNIHAVVKGTAINHTGRANNPTSPRPELQTKVILDAWNNAGIDPATIGYLESHGTGTQLGDPIEINALTKAFKKYTDEKAFCAVGSAK